MKVLDAELLAYQYAGRLFVIREKIDGKHIEYDRSNAPSFIQPFIEYLHSATNFDHVSVGVVYYERKGKQHWFAEFIKAGDYRESSMVIGWHHTKRLFTQQGIPFVDCCDDFEGTAIECIARIQFIDRSQIDVALRDYNEDPDVEGFYLMPVAVSRDQLILDDRLEVPDDAMDIVLSPDEVDMVNGVLDIAVSDADGFCMIDDMIQGLNADNETTARVVYDQTVAHYQHQYHVEVKPNTPVECFMKSAVSSAFSQYLQDRFNDRRHS